MQIFDADSRLILETDVDDTSYRYRRIMAFPTLILNFSCEEPTEIPVGSYCMYQGERFELLSPQALKMQNLRNYEYTATFSSPTGKAAMWKFRNNVDRRLKFLLTAKPHEHLDMLVWNMNQRESFYTYARGECVEGVETLISYDHDYCADALSRMADTFKTEFEFEVRGNTIYIHLHKVEKFADSPLPLSYGQGNGFKPGVGRANYTDGEPVTILYPEGGERNIEYYAYGRNSKILLLPASTRLGYDGEKFSDEPGFNPQKARYYRTSADGFSLTNESAATAPYGKDDSLDCSEIYPSRVGEVTAVVTETGKNEDGKDFIFHDIIDNTIPSTLNFEECIINDETMTIVFQSGMLSGREFDVEYVHKERKFKLIPIDADGITMPEEAGVFVPKVGDKYAVFHVNLPSSYYAEAEITMLKEAIRYLYDHEIQRYTFTGTLDSIFAKKNWGKISAYMVPGAFIRFTAKKWQEEPADIRIVGIKDYVNSQQKPELELSNGTVSATVLSTMKSMEAKQDVIPAQMKAESIAYTKRRYRDARETATTLQELIRSEAKSLLEQYTNTISPITVHTMQTLVGDEALQFEFIDSIDSAQKVDCPLVWKDGVLRSDAKSFLRHLSLMAGSELSSERKAQEYPRWTINEYLSAGLDTNKAYYLYAVCSKNLDENKKGTGYFTTTTVPLPFDGDKDYNLLVGILSSEYEGARSWRTMYGYTEILPGTITTDRIVSSDGQSYFDMVNNAMALGEKLRYENEKLYLDFLLVNGANVGGWIFRNNRLESADGSIWLDGNTNKVQIGGADSSGVGIDGETGNLDVRGLIHMSTGYVDADTGNADKAQIIAIKPTTKQITIGLSGNTKDLGSRCLIFNTNKIGGVSHIVRGCGWRTSESGVTVFEPEYDITYEVGAQEIIEVTLFRMSENTYAYMITNRFGYQDFRTTGTKGRYPLAYAMGKMTYSYDSSGNHVALTGRFYDGEPISSKMRVERTAVGKYYLRFESGTLPTDYLIFVQARSGNQDYSTLNKATVYETTDTMIHIDTSDDASRNDGPFDFVIFDNANWDY